MTSLYSSTPRHVFQEYRMHRTPFCAATYMWIGKGSLSHKNIYWDMYDQSSR